MTIHSSLVYTSKPKPKPKSMKDDLPNESFFNQAFKLHVIPSFIYLDLVYNK